MEHSPTPYTWKPFCPPAYFSLASENFSRSRSASLEHNASSAERVLPTLGAKIRKIPIPSKCFGRKFIMGDKNNRCAGLGCTYKDIEV